MCAAWSMATRAWTMPPGFVGLVLQDACIDGCHWQLAASALAPHTDGQAASGTPTHHLKRVVGLAAFDGDCERFAATDAGAGDSQRLVLSDERSRQRVDQSRSCGTDGVSNGDRTAIDIDPRVVKF